MDLDEEGLNSSREQSPDQKESTSPPGSPKMDDHQKGTSDTVPEEAVAPVEDEDNDGEAMEEDSGSQDPLEPLETFSWEDLDSRFKAMVADRDKAEAELMDEFGELIDVSSQNQCLSPFLTHIMCSSSTSGLQRAERMRSTDQ